MTMIKWKCPICSGKNSDEYESAKVLACLHCESESDWEDILADQQKKEFSQVSQ